MSIAKATSIIEKNENEDAKDVLCKELLKQWSPNKKRSLH
jgi:hypothetical protein